MLLKYYCIIVMHLRSLNLHVFEYIYSNIVSNGPKYRVPSQIDFNRCREEIASALNDFGNRWCKREGVECNAMKEWKLCIFKIVDKHTRAVL